MKIRSKSNQERYKISIWDRLTAPSAAIKEPDERRQARLLSLVLFLLIPLGYFVTTILPILTGKIGIVLQDPAFYVAMLTMVIIILLYIGSRSRYYKVVAAILVGFEILSMYSISLLDHSSGEAFILDYLVIPVIFASLFLSLGTVIVVALVNLAAILVYPILANQFGSAQLSGNEVGFYVALAVIILIMTHYRNLLEKDRRMALARSEQLYRTLAGNFPNGTVLLFDQSLRYLVADGRGLPLLGVSKEKLEGKTVQEALPVELSRMVEPLCREVLSGQTIVTELTYSELTSEVHLVPLKDEQDQIFAGMMMTQDITRRKRLEEQLAQEKERLRVTLQSIGDGVIATDTHGKIVLLNSVAEQLTGWQHQEAVGRPLKEIFQIINELNGEEQEIPVEKVLASNQIVALANHTVLIGRDGNRHSIADTAAPILDKAKGELLGAVLVFRDVTEKQKMEQELLKAQKLESVSVLAGGIAHDFNNILTTVIGYISLAKLEASKEDIFTLKDLVGLLDEAETATFRAQGLTQQLLTFAKGGTPVKKLADLKGVLEEAARFVLHGSRVLGYFEIAPDLWPVEIDEGQISQVIHNLVLNAIQAMPEGGTLIIKAENVANSTPGEPNLSLAGPKCVKVTIQDEGAGIPAEILPKIFDPYFTTKPSGNGLGLATCYSIINKHSGYLTVQSQVGRGTAFYIYLPVPAENTAILNGETNIVSVVSLEPAQAATRHKSARVLVVDDEPTILNLLKRILGQRGYEVNVTSQAQQGLKLYEEALNSQQPYALVILDLTLPGNMGGLEMLQELRALDPGVKALVSSGYSNDPVVAHYQDYGFAAALSKPFNVKELLSKVESLLTLNGEPGLN